MFHVPVTVTVMVVTASNDGSLGVVTPQLYCWLWMLSLTGAKTRSSICIAVVLNTVTPALFSHSNTAAPLAIGVVQVTVCSIPTVKGASLPVTLTPVQIRTHKRCLFHTATFTPMEMAPVSLPLVLVTVHVKVPAKTLASLLVSVVL